MKKIVFILTAFILLLALLLPMNISATSSSATLKGPDTVRAGDTIVLNFNVNGSGILGASGTLSYDSNQVTLQGTAQKIASPWAVEFNGKNFLAYDNNLSNPINSNKTLFTVTFKVKSVAMGTNIKISYTNVKTTDGNTDTNLGTISYSKTVAAPLSTNNNLASLTVSNATISPAFSAGTTKYSASVPFEVSKLNISATAADSKAKVSVNNSELTPDGTTDVIITVTAENNSKKTYTISVHREQDPNYKPSGNNNLSGITVEGFLLSPVFSEDNIQYVVWLPYETTSVKINGTAADSKASVEVVGGVNLVAGQDNPVKVICTAENGDKKEYTVIVKRASAHGESGGETIPPSPTATPEQTAPPITTPEQTAQPTTIPPETTPPTIEPEETNSGFAWWWLIVVCAVSLVVGFLIGYFSKKNIKN